MRKRLVTGLAALVLAGLAGWSPSTPAQADPSISDVQKRVDRLYHEAEIASEQLDQARLQLQQLRGGQRGLQADERREQVRLDSVRDQLSRAIVTQYEGVGLAAAGQAIGSSDPSSFVTNLSTMSAYGDLQGQLFQRYATEAKALRIRQQATAARADELARIKAQLAQAKATIADRLAGARALLGRLKEQERQALLSRSTVRLPSEVPASGRAAAAVRYAMEQVGKAYVYGAAGPNAFDCSGLTMAAWARAGVALPHSSSAQYGSGPHIAASQLEPGDLVFYYSPISHVGMYIGNGLIVNAENPRDGIRVTGLYSMPYVGAVRPG